MVKTLYIPINKSKNRLSVNSIKNAFYFDNGGFLIPIVDVNVFSENVKYKDFQKLINYPLRFE